MGSNLQSTQAYIDFIKQLKSNCCIDPYVESPDEKPVDLTTEEGIIDWAKRLERQKSKVGGTSIKAFTRIDDSIAGVNNRDILDSKYMREYINEVQTNPNCKYMSVYNDLIKDGHIPRYFSVLIKNCHHNPYRVILEAFGSRVSNLLGVPTTYCFPIQSETKRCENSVYYRDKNFAAASLDFADQRKSFELLGDNDMVATHFHTMSFQEAVTYVKCFLRARFSSRIDKECEQKFLEDFARSYLERTLLFKDRDFSSRNTGMFVDENNKFSLINFDMEGMLYLPLPEYMLRKKLEKDIAFCSKAFPNVLDEFMAKVQVAHLDGTFHRILDDFNDKSKTNKTDLNMIEKLFLAENKTFFAKVHEDIDMNCETLLDCYATRELS